MSRAERAKQFMPFAALKGFEEALREREKMYDGHEIVSQENTDRLREEAKEENT